MTAKRTLITARAVRDGARGALGLLLLLALSACSSDSRATSPKEVRKLAGSSQAQQSRKAAEEHLRKIVRAYDERTPLSLGLVTVNDLCVGGTAKELFFQTGDDQYKIRCAMRVTAYYGAAPHRIGDVLDDVFTAGDHDASGATANTIPFDHNDYRKRLVAYYRGHGPNPTGPDAPEPGQVFDPSQTLSWDTVRSSRKRLIEEPEPCAESDPPVKRCLSEPASTTVADLRKRYGMVFRLQMSVADYYRVAKDGRTTQTWR
ncbi:hypothetical protein ACFVXE_22810 [Streptomyces sp. NPDC058231]|uniref:hypothetical protein n=1 Tax=Streptomyces sp. NPDC058231 TaxID=3346392 RepID=UPI0036E2B35C